MTRWPDDQLATAPAATDPATQRHFVPLEDVLREFATAPPVDAAQFRADISDLGFV